MGGVDNILLEKKSCNPFQRTKNVGGAKSVAHFYFNPVARSSHKPTKGQSERLTLKICRQENHSAKEFYSRWPQSSD